MRRTLFALLLLPLFATPAAASTALGDIPASTLMLSEAEIVAGFYSKTFTDANFQPLHTNLTALASLTSAADKGLFWTGAGTASTYDLTAFGRTLGGSADAAAARTTLVAANSVHVHSGADITSGTVDGDRLPALSAAKRGGAPATGTPSGLFLRDDDTWAAAGGGSTPTGTGFRHVTAGAEDAAAVLVVDADVDAGAAIAFSKLAGVAAASHSHAAADVTSGVLAIGRLATGTPDGTKFVRDDGTLAVPTGTGPATPTGTGFTHITAGAQDAAAKKVDTADVNDAQVTYAKIQNVTDSRLLGRSGGAGAPMEITVGAGLALSGGALVGRTAITVSGFYTSSMTVSSETTFVLVEAVGGGGGGGGVTSASGQAAAAGGGAGGAFLRYYTNITGGTSITISQGSAGLAGSATGPTAGGAGGNTTVTWSGLGGTLTAKGGGGGNAMATGTAIAFANGGAGQLSTVGMINGSGEPGAWGMRQSGTVAASGSGGSSAWGGGGVGWISTGIGNPGQGVGAGGSGACQVNNGGGKAGGVGTAGGVWITEFRAQ